MIESERELRLAKSRLSQQQFSQSEGLEKKILSRQKETSVATKLLKNRRILSRQSRGVEGENACRNKEIHVMTVFVELVEDFFKTTLLQQDNLVATRTRLLHQNYVVTLLRSVATKSKKKIRESVITENCMIRQKPTTKTKHSVVT